MEGFAYKAYRAPIKDLQFVEADEYKSESAILQDLSEYFEQNKIANRRQKQEKSYYLRDVDEDDDDYFDRFSG